MASIPKEPVSPLVQYLLTVTGEPGEIDAFVAKAQDEEADQPFAPSKALPVPAQMAEVDIFAVPYYHVIEGQWARAADMLNDLDVDAELAEMLRDTSRAKDVSAWLQARGDSDAMKGVELVRQNLASFGTLTPAQWKRQTWGPLTESMLSERERIVDIRVVYRFACKDLSLDFVENLADNHPALAFGAIAVDELGGQERYIWLSLTDDEVEQEARKLDVTRPTWLQKPPRVFSLQ